jgi:hypothetical protein
MWLDLLRYQVAQRGLGPVAADLAYSKTALSLVLNGKYDSDTSRIEKAVMDTYGTIACPFEERHLPAADCHFWRQCDHPTSSPWAQHHWAACQTCVHNPKPKEPQ